MKKLLKLDPGIKETKEICVNKKSFEMILCVSLSIGQKKSQNDVSMLE